MAYDAELAQEAHNRFMQRRRNFIETNPNAVSNTERQATLGRYQQQQDAAALRQHELDVLKQQGDNQTGVAAWNAKGMENQGSAAARFNSEAARYAADKTAATEGARISSNEKTLLQQIAANQATQNYAADKTLEGTKATANASVEAAKAAAAAKAASDAAHNETAVKVAKIGGDATVQAANERAAAAAEAARAARIRKFQEDMAQNKFLLGSRGMSAEVYFKMTPQEQAAWRKNHGYDF